MIWKDNKMKKTVLITGCSSGFGKATARHFSDGGWNVIATMRNPESCRDLSAIDDVLITPLDVQDRASIERAIETGISRFGRIDALINNAGFGLFGVFEATPRDKIREQFDVNVFGVMDVTRAILPHFRQNKAGLILNISSGAGVFTLPMISLYCASKFALEGFSEAITYELAPLGIIVKVIEPGGVISTNFGKRSGVEAAGAEALADYDRFIASAQEIFAGMRGQRLATEEDVAKVIFDAATDGSDQFRYVATEDIQPLVNARRETSEQDYMNFMRSQFMITERPF
jgi:NAD(P)-dependent dehydrogenase (short-subunit alcohol dehydrogenase family)